MRHLLRVRGRHGRDRMVVKSTTTYVISAYHHWCCEFESRSGRGVTTSCDKVYQWLATGRWFSPGPPVSSTNKTDRHDISEILLKVALNTINQTNKQLNIDGHQGHQYHQNEQRSLTSNHWSQNRPQERKVWRYQRGNQKT